MATTNFAYVQQGTIERIAAELIENLTTSPDSNPIFRLLPIVEKREQFLTWEQKDIEGGLMQVRALDGKFPTVSRVGAKGFLQKPGYYGEQYPISEEDLTNRRMLGTFGTPELEGELVNEGLRYLTNRYIRRAAYIGWTLLTTGTFSVTDAMGIVQHTDSFPLRTVTTPFSDWSVLATATPITDLQNLYIYGRGYGATFGAQAEVWMNQKTFNYITQNQNANDFGGIRESGGATVKFMGAVEVNGLARNYNIPQIMVYDGTYRTANGEQTVPSVWIPDDTIVVFGSRENGERIGEFRQVFNATARDTNFYAAAVYDDDPPFLPRVFSAVNMGPVIYYPNSILRIPV